MGEGRHGGWQLLRVVVHRQPSRQLPRHHRGARWCAERKVAVAVLKDDAALSQPLQVGRLHIAVAIRRGSQRAELVGHDEQDVRPVAHARLSSRAAPATALPEACRISTTTYSRSTKT